MDIRSVRARIDAVDEQILKLFLERMSLVEEIAAIKRARRLPILDARREREILARVSEKAGVYGPYACHLFTVLMELSSARQAEPLSGPVNTVSRKEEAL